MNITNQQILEAFYAAGENKTKAADDLGMSRSAFRRRFTAAMDGQSADHCAIANQAGPVGDVRYYPDLQSQDQAIRAAGFDPELFDIQRVSAWPTQIKGGEIRQMVAVCLVPKSAVVDATERLAAALDRFSLDGPRHKAKPRATPTTGFNHEIIINDHHFGKLAWAPESGQDYDLEIAEGRYLDATATLLDAPSKEPEQITLVIGNDLMHSDSPSGVTAKSGNVLDMDGRIDRIMDVTLRTLVQSIDLCLASCPKVNIITISGNHDNVSVKWLGRVLSAWYRRDDRVSLDISPSVRKYYRWGKVMRGFQHGDTCKPADVPRLFLDECDPYELAQTKWRYFSRGHLHKSASDTFGTTHVETLPALCGADHWHAENGFTNGILAATSFLYHTERGRVARFNHNV